jgi:hypothetical protein
MYIVTPSAMLIQMVLPALKAVERNVGAWIREVRAYVMQSRAAQSATTVERRERARARRIRMQSAGGVVAFRTRRSESGAPRAHTLSERPWTETGLSANSVMLPVPDTGPHYPMVRTPERKC